MLLRGIEQERKVKETEELEQRIEELERRAEGGHQRQLRRLEQSQSAFASSRTVATTVSACASLRYDCQLSISGLRVRLHHRLPRTPGSARAGIVTLFARWGWKKDHEFNVRWLKAARRLLKPDGTLWVTGTHHIIFSLGFALQGLDLRSIRLRRFSKGCNP